MWLGLAFVISALAACAQDGDSGPPPLPTRCSGAGSAPEYHCSGDTHYVCVHGEAHAWQSCDPGLCVPGVITCTVHPGIDSRCEAARLNAEFDDDVPGFLGYCDGSIDVECDGAYAIELHDCGRPELCHETRSGSLCLASVTPDPLCNDLGVYLRCDGELSITCAGEQRTVYTRDCSANGYRCVDGKCI
jgi:hypothetical protein